MNTILKTPSQNTLVPKWAGYYTRLRECVNIVFKFLQNFLVFMGRFFRYIIIPTYISNECCYLFYSGELWTYATKYCLRTMPTTLHALIHVSLGNSALHFLAW
jgi:hypothetical protein